MAGWYDFHELSVAACLIAFAINYIDEDEIRSASITIFLLLLTKEDMSLLAVFFAFFSQSRGIAALELDGPWWLFCSSPLRWTT